MLDRLFKIFLLVLVVLPLWLTIIAIADETTPSESDYQINIWKERLNKELLNVSDPKVQITEILPSAEFSKLTPDLLEKSVRIDLAQVNIRGASKLGLKYLDQEGRLEQLVYLPVKLFVQRQVPVAARDLSRGEVVTVSDYEMKWMDASLLASGVAKESEVRDSQLRSPVATNKVIYRNKLQSERIVAKGDQIQIKVVGRGVSVIASGIAQEAGSVGDTIKILNTDSKREIYAVVSGPKMAEVRL
ncbi:MAG: flagella basal body P-ring formation protein FlgA [Deltaproteobacteria bacterium CG11_big_fil_rev_8_21_14_0_20_45_16]|nr:MAG: flagella basal body P-ring formation protein FlgA [Deltaproteobacteria bacterium CG11_big_fil_rev_8_21_14_0_20_45_16]